MLWRRVAFDLSNVIMPSERVDAVKYSGTIEMRNSLSVNERHRVDYFGGVKTPLDRRMPNPGGLVSHSND
jgi:hypothetical protein